MIVYMLTTYMNVNFNKMLPRLTFQQSCAQYLYLIQIHKQIIKSEGSSVNTISGKKGFENVFAKRKEFW